MAIAPHRSLMSRAATLAERWQDAMFQVVPADSSALLRIAIGVIGIASVLGLTPVGMYWSPGGMVPSGGGFGIKDWLAEVGLAGIAGAAFWLAMVTAFGLLAIGFFSRTMTVICLAGSVVQAHWNPLPLSMAWQVEVCLLFALMFANPGGTLSMDAWVQMRRLSTVAHTPMWPLLVIRYQVALIYFSSGLWKLVGTAWRDGSALHHVLNNHLYARFSGPLTPFGESMATVGTYVTLGWELTFPLMLLHPVGRRVALATGVLVHLGIWATMEVGAFSWIMLASYVAFLDPTKLAFHPERLKQVASQADSG